MQRKKYSPLPEGGLVLVVTHRKAHKKGSKNLGARYLVKCGDFDNKIEIYYGDGTLEIGGVHSSIQNWREILLPLLEFEDVECKLMFLRNQKNSRKKLEELRKIKIPLS